MPVKASYEPTPEEIAEATARIRAKWRKDKSRRQVVEIEPPANDEPVEDGTPEILGDG